MARILLLGSDKERVGGLRALLRQDGHQVERGGSPDGWTDRERDVRPEVVIAAVPATDPVLRSAPPVRRGFPAPLLFVQRQSDPHRGLDRADRLVDRIESPFMSEEFLGRVDALVRVRRVILRAAVRDRGRSGDDADADRSGESAWRRVAGRLAAVLGSRVPRYDKPLGPYLEVAARVAEWADARDGFDPGHAERVANFCGIMADEMRLPDGEAASLIRAAMLHDIGKVAIPVEVLRQPGPLDDDQMRLVRTHTERGARILRALDTTDDVARTILYHHERPDGAGYHGKRADETPRSARILAVAEQYDAMTRSRVRSTLTSEEALRVLEHGRGDAFDPDCVAALSRALRPRRGSLPVSGLLGN